MYMTCLYAFVGLEGSVPGWCSRSRLMYVHLCMHCTPTCIHVSWLAWFIFSSTLCIISLWMTVVCTTIAMLINVEADEKVDYTKKQSHMSIWALLHWTAALPLYPAVAMATRLATVAMATSACSHHYTIHVSMHDGCMDAYRSKLLLPERFIPLGLCSNFALYM